MLIKVHEKCEAEGRAFRGTSHEGKMIEIVTTLFRNRAIRYNNDRETRAFLLAVSVSCSSGPEMRSCCNILLLALCRTKDRHEWSGWLARRSEGGANKIHEQRGALRADKIGAKYNVKELGHVNVYD